MNFKYFFLLLSIAAFAACSDELSQIGSSIQPDSDIVNIKADTLSLSDSISTFQVDSIYALSSTALLGNYSDVTYGDTQADFMAQFDCVENFGSKDSATYNKAAFYTTTLTLLYQDFSGDENEPMQASAYQLTKPLNKEIYSNSSYSKYCDKSVLLGRKSYTAKNKAANLDSIEIKFGDKFNSEMSNLLKKNSPIFSNKANFDEYFKGVYVTTNSGSGSIVKVDSIALCFNYFIKGEKQVITKRPGKTKENKDTTYSDTTYVTVYNKHTKYIKTNRNCFLINRYKNNHLPIPTKNDNYTYVKSPAGLFNRIKIPMQLIADKLKVSNKSKLNGAKLTINAERPGNTSKTLLPASNYLMLIKESEMVDFFQNKTTFDENKHAYATFNSTTNSYTFSNISKIITKYLSETKSIPASESYVLLPVSVDLSTTPATIRHANQPTAIKLFKQGLNLSFMIAK